MHVHVHVCQHVSWFFPFFLLIVPLYVGSFNIFKTYVAPYVGDWLFILMLGLLMAVLSFIIDYLIQILGEGATTVHAI